MLGQGQDMLWLQKPDPCTPQSPAIPPFVSLTLSGSIPLSFSSTTWVAVWGKPSSSHPWARQSGWATRWSSMARKNLGRGCGEWEVEQGGEQGGVAGKDSVCVSGRVQRLGNSRVG